MDIHYKGTKYEPTPEILAQAEKQIGGLDAFLDGEARAELELGRAVGSKQKGDIWRAELNIITPNKRYRAESTKAKLSHAVTTVARDVSRELRRDHDRSRALFKKGGSTIKDLLRGFGKQ